MTARHKKLVMIVAGCLIGLVLVLGIAGIWIAQSTWFREYVRQRIIRTVEDSTGGRVEIGEFLFDWRHLRVEIRQFVLHGTEPAGQEALFRARNITVDLGFRALAGRRTLNIAALDVQEPQANVILYPNGLTNIPQPKIPHPSDKSALDTIVDLAIGRFTVRDGSLRLADQKVPFSAQGEDLAAQLSYERVPGRYRGQIAIHPLFAQYDQNKRVDLDVKLSVVLGKDRVEITNATLATANSYVQISGSADHLVSPRFSARTAGQIDLLEMKQILGSLFPISIPRDSPHVVNARIDASLDDRQFRIISARLALGRSSIEASGTFRNTKFENGAVQFRTQLALAEVGRMLEPALQADGELELGGRVRLNNLSDYRVDAALAGSNMALRRGQVYLSNMRLSSKIAADPHRIDLNPLTLQIGAGQVNGSAALENFSQYQVQGNLSRFDIQELINSVAARRVPYAGVLSGPIEIAGDWKRAGSVRSTARLNIAPGGRGVPLSGNVNVDYDAPRDTVNFRNSYLALPSSRLDFSGALGNKIAVHLTSRNLQDFGPALSLMSNPPAQLPVHLDPGGSVRIDGTIAGRLSAPNIAGHVAVSRFRVEQRHFDQLAADVAASNNRLAVDNASLRRGSLLATLQGSVGLDRWSVQPSEPLSADASIQNGDLLDVLALAGRGNLPLSGDLSMTARVSGTAGDPRGNASLRIARGMAYGEPLDLVEGESIYGGQSVSIPSLRIESGEARANLNATFTHPAGNFSQGAIHVHLDTNQVALARLRTIQKRTPDLNGTLQADLDTDLVLEPVNGSPKVRLTAGKGMFEARSLRRQGRNLGDLTARLQTSGSTLGFQLTSDFAGSKIQADGQTDLMRDYETSANLSIQNLPVQDALGVAGRDDLATSGLLSAKGAVRGTLSDPQATLDVDLTKAVLRRQPLDRLEGRLIYSNVLVELDNALIQMGTSRINLSGSFSHPPQDFSSGDLRLQAQGGPIQLAQVVSLQEWKPGIAGTLQISVDGAAKLNPPGASARLSFSGLKSQASLAGVRAQGRDLGGFTARVEGTGSSVTADLESNLAQSSIKASVRAELTGDFPATGQLTFSGVRYANWAGLLTSSAGSPNFDALLEGSAHFSGPFMQPANLTGNAELTKAEFYATSPTRASGGPPEFTLKNDGPVAVVAAQSGIQVKQARWTGPSSQLSVSGNVMLRPLVFNLSVNADADLAWLHRIRDDISSEGHVQLNASVKGPPREPTVNGKVELRDAAFQTSDMPNGISKANGVILLSGTTATIQSMTAESGGGRLTIDGVIARPANQLAYNLGVRANRVQIRTQSGASIGVNADLKLNGTQRAGVLAGTVTIRDVGFNPRTDVGTILAETANPPPTPATPAGFLAKTRLDLSVKTAPGASFQSAYTTSLEADANLTMRGTLANPGMLGRVTISSGELLFFGTKYTLDAGSVSFFNPAKIDPILDLNLTTTARGVQVTLSVTGPINNMNLAYQSDPPLQFSEIVGLLATGRMPTSDPVLLAHQPAIAPQTFQQMGESAILSKVVTSPVSGQLKRVFGVTELKIDPTFTSGSELPQARLTLQQKVTTSLTFTYITDLTRADSQILRAEWTLNPRWSAVATRQENGLVAIDLFYKRKIH